MAIVKLSADGQEFTLEDRIAESDELLRQALTPFYPEMAQAEIKREKRAGELIVTLIKRAGPKGSAEGFLNPEGLGQGVVSAAAAILISEEEANLSEALALEGTSDYVAGRSQAENSPLAELVATPEQINPVLSLAWELRLLEATGQLGLETLLALQSRIDGVLEIGAADCHNVETALLLLKTATPIASRLIPGGF